MKKKVISLLLIISVILLAAISSCYGKGPWKGKVIDAETKQPIEGAAVVAVWEKELRGPAGGETRFLDAEETVTDKNGEFKIPSKEFLSIPLIRITKGPFFTFYKPGYSSAPKWVLRMEYPKNTQSDYFETKGALVELEAAKTKEQRLNAMYSADLGDIIVPRKKIPYLKKLINEERKSVGLQLYEGGH